MYKYYIYIVKVEDEVRYVGKGTKDRFKHAVSGASSVPELNKDFFEGRKIEVFKYDFKEAGESAGELEKRFISSFIYDGFELYNKITPEREYLGDNYLDMFESKPCARAIQCRAQDVKDYLLDKVREEIIKENFQYSEKENI